MNYDEAIAWCFEYQAHVEFFYEQNQQRVTVRASGFPYNTATGNSFIEAVEETKKRVERAEQVKRDRP
jgi:hypothetical protein